MFHKGDAVTYLHTWDNKGTVMVRDLTVFSCGKKQMILVNDAGERFQGTFFPPSGDMGIHGRVVPRLSAQEAYDLGIAMASDILAAQRAHFNDRLQRWGDDPGFRKAIEASWALLHEPRVERDQHDPFADKSHVHDLTPWSTQREPEGV